MNILKVPHETLLDQVIEGFLQRDRERILSAYQAAYQAHGSYRPALETRDEGRPTIDHPVRVMYSLYAEQDVRDVDVLCVALLHDVRELSDEITADDLVERFGERVAGMVDRLTRKPGQSRADYAEAIRQAPFEVFLVELAARLDNLRTAYRHAKSMQPYYNETRKYFLLHAETLLDRHPGLNSYCSAIRMLLDSD